MQAGTPLYIGNKVEKLPAPRTFSFQWEGKDKNKVSLLSGDDWYGKSMHDRRTAGGLGGAQCKTGRPGPVSLRR